jgi:large subunit ribosomal protein L19
VRRAKLYYLRDRVGKRARVRERRYVGPEEVIEAGLLYGDEGGATDASGQTADEVVSAEGGADLAAEAPNLEAEGVAETPAEEAALQPGAPEGDAGASAGEAPASPGEPQTPGESEGESGANEGAEPKAAGEGDPAPDADDVA